jgi:hypothetical protein
LKERSGNINMVEYVGSMNRGPTLPAFANVS